ncbi:thiamine pyrophosphate-binding protein [Carboxydothermus pertinax]|uniref:Acetolactate synthase n=1 Tax=Carboxydothermus pertinax TaxID=870242 RepID=A0A1L8CUH2_9THEO|nr:thiamine pyrophosphate-binding protein [Carboxydothermus pertinax]GAV22605.1 hypothetical protein cpu_11150 [Carboxydothermus pertinax]
MIKVSDFVIKKLYEHGIENVFLISGGGAMHLVDSVGKNKKIKYICCHHEQACAMAAEGYFRASGKMAAVIVTTGPGGTNTITGLIGEWLDSIPVLYISGQVKTETTIKKYSGIGLRQLGDQEINIIDIVKPVTKYAVMIEKPEEIKYHLDKAIFIAKEGRPGPVWIDIPLDIQGSYLNEEKLINYEPPKVNINISEINSKVERIINELLQAKKPVIIGGHGVRLANAQQEYLDLIKILKAPVLSTFNGFDLVPSNHPFYVGQIGTIGSRAGNIALQNADFALFIGTRNNIRQVGFNWKDFARRAKKIVIDIDEAELKKPTIVPDIALLSDAKVFLQIILEKIKNYNIPDWSKWLAWCLEKKNKYPNVLEEYKNIKKFIHPYYFINTLSKVLKNDEIVVTGNGTACVVYFQAAEVKNGQRIFWNSGCASMGYDLPAAIGAAIANPRKRIICLAGDGSIQMNIQELETIRYYNLPIKIFVLNNNGYHSIRQTQDNYFNGHYVACDPKTGVGLPDIRKIGRAYGLKTHLLSNHRGLKEKLTKILNEKGGSLTEVKLTDNYIFAPKQSSVKLEDGRIISKPLEDMYPFLDLDEMKKNIFNLD